MDFSLGRLPRSTQIPSRQPGSTDLSLGPAKPGQDDSTPFGDIANDKAGPDWRNLLSRWVQEHAYYPQEARMNGEEGVARVHVEALPNGKVTSVQLIGRSGSMWLDLALQALFRDARIPRVPGSDDPITFDFTMHYILIRR